MRPFRFAVQLMDWSDHDHIAEAAVEAEELGYEELYSYDHVGTVDPFIPLMVAAEATTTLRVGPLVINNEFHHPVLLARTAATLDRLTGGRLVLGMGTGYMQSEHDATGIELRPPGPRVDRLEESLIALRSLLDSGSAHLDGTHHRLALKRLGVYPAQSRVPILVGGFGRRVIDLAATYADIVQFTGLTHAADGTPSAGGFASEGVAERAAWLDESERNADIERSVLTQVLHVGDGGDAVLAEGASRLGIEPSTAASSPFVLCGTVDEIVDKLNHLRDTLGISHIVVRDAVSFAPVVERLAGI